MEERTLAYLDHPVSSPFWPQAIKTAEVATLQLPSTLPDTTEKMVQDSQALRERLSDCLRKVLGEEERFN